MKYKYPIIFIISLIALILLIFVIKRIYEIKSNKISSIQNIKSFRFSYTTGNYIYANVSYEIQCSNECIAIIKPNNASEEKQLETTINKSLLNTITRLLNKYKVYKWNRFSTSDKNVLDGNSFSMYIKMEDRSLSASGYMIYPKNYNIVKKELDKIFMEIYKNEVTKV